MNNSSGLSKILSGINTTLNIANKVVPIYNQAKPLVTNINKTYKTFKNTSKDIPQLIKLMKVKNQIKKDMNTKPISFKTSLKSNSNTYSNINNPTFFI